MNGALLIATDLDRTLIPNGPQVESPGTRSCFAALVARTEVTLVYVTGRHRALVEQAIEQFGLPIPDWVATDVGTQIHEVGPERKWRRETRWEDEIRRDWNGHDHAELARRLQDLSELTLQEPEKQNDCKLSYYVATQRDRDAISEGIDHRLEELGVEARLIWSVDDEKRVGLLDVLPARASKLHALEALMKLQGFADENSVFCGDSGNDIEILASHIPAVLVANSQPDVRALALRRAHEMGYGDRLYIARGGFMGMNGNYCGGVLEGIAHYHPQTLRWMETEWEDE